MDSRDGAAASLRYHGGNLDAARRLFPDAPVPWIDLSTGINPVPYPVGEISPNAWTRLPDVAALERCGDGRLSRGAGGPRSWPPPARRR